MNTQELAELVACYQHTAAKLEQAMRLGRQWQLREPALPERVESIEEWNECVARHEVWQGRKDSLHTLEQRARAAHQQAQTRLAVALPTRVWVRVGDVGVGKQFDDWGGAHYNIKIARWGDAMPSLATPYYS